KRPVVIGSWLKADPTGAGQLPQESCRTFIVLPAVREPKSVLMTTRTFGQYDVHALRHIDRHPALWWDRIYFASHRRGPPEGRRTTRGCDLRRWLATSPNVVRFGIPLTCDSQVARSGEDRNGADRTREAVAERDERVLQREIPRRAPVDGVVSQSS